MFQADINCVVDGFAMVGRVGPENRSSQFFWEVEVPRQEVEIWRYVVVVFGTVKFAQCVSVAGKTIKGWEGKVYRF